MAVTLYVDELWENDSLGITKNQESIDYNLITIQIAGITPIEYFAIGRFVCLMTVGEDRSLIFMDVKSEPDLAKTLVSECNYDLDLKNRITALLEIYNLNYDRMKDGFVLTLGTAPPI